MIIRKGKQDLGQATVEYIMVFAMIAILAVSMAKALTQFMGNTTSSLGYVLTQQLTVGVCENACFFDGYKNQ